MTWKAFHNRGETLRSVIATAAIRRDGVLPMDVEGVAETFADELDLIGALQLKWHTRLAGQVERIMGGQPLDLDAAVALAWSRTSEEFGGVRLILDNYRQNPTDDRMARALETATRKEHIFLAVMAGKSSLHDDAAVPVGAAIEERARELHRGAPVRLDLIDEQPAEPRGSLLERLRAVVAA